MTYEDAREQCVGSSTLGNPRTSSMFTHAVGEPYMDALAIFKSPIRLGSVQWTTAMSVGQQFLDFKLPEAFTLNETFHKLMLRTYVFYKPTIKITIQINATPQHMGLLALWWDPFNQYANSAYIPDSYSGKPKQKIPNKWTVSGQPHAYLQACDSSPVHLPIRYEHPQTCLTTNSVDAIGNMGSFSVMVINPLECPPTSSSTVTVQMFMSFDDVDLAVPIWDHMPIIPALQQSDDGREVVDLRGPSDFVEVGAQPDANTYGPPPKAKETPWWEKGLGFLGGVAGAVWNGFTGNWGGAVKNGISAVSSLLMDKPSDPLRAVHNMLFPIPPLAHTQGVGGFVRLDAAPMGGYTQHDYSSSDPTEQKMMTLMKTPMMVADFDWSATDAPDTELIRIPLTPSFCHKEFVPGTFYNSNGAENPTPGTYCLRQPTYLSKVSSLFRFWRGSLRLHFQFITTSLHTGKVSCTFIPNNYDSPSSQSLPQQTCASTEIFDVAGNKNFDFEPQFASTIERKMWYDWTSVDPAVLDDRFIYGWVEIRVTGQLTVTNAIPNAVHCNVFMSAGDDFFCESLFHNPYSFPAGYPVSTGLAPPAFSPAIQQSEEDPEYKSESSKDPLNNMVSTTPTQMTNQAIGDIRDPCRRANYLGIFPLVMTRVDEGEGPAGFWRGQLRFFNNPVYTDEASGPDGVKPIGKPSVTPGAIPIGAPNPQQNLMAYVSDMFVFYSGAIDFTFIPYTAGSSGVHFKAFYYPLQSDDVDTSSLISIGNGSFGSLAAHTTVLGQQRALQITTPFTSNYNQLALLEDVGSAYDEEVYSSGIVTLEATMTNNEGIVNNEGQVTLYVEVYKSFGDDARFSWAVSPGAEWTLTSYTAP